MATSESRSLSRTGGAALEYRDFRIDILAGSLWIRTSDALLSNPLTTTAPSRLAVRATLISRYGGANHVSASSL